ncbi:uncharacterized protein LAESUDRAFT_664429 [Laetiporus sulphureus 93-53]|uniref:Tim44-like domain-containing protein n=1 Tax=Laetiporus sulphureus 93-53 TaxID=1314785 RepID=A0A165BL01_9APHY|nr:uncharacterized protein LAESUDRAFT_664429 [Laetiporus sulphureus 93-53]KZT01246.1 hypothetical protein LAESUDRAFT_664429 [Laetiporus sulphureus 93-53]
MSSLVSHRCSSFALRSLPARSSSLQRPLLSGLLLNQRRCYALRIGKRQQKKDRTEEENVHDIETMKYMASRLPADIYGSYAKLLDLHIPSLKSPKEDAKISDHIYATLKTMRNWFRNAQSMAQMASYKGFIERKRPWNPQIFCAQSTRDSAWIAPIRQAALDTYVKLNEAVANRDEKTIKRLAVDEMEKDYLRLARSQDPSRVYVWKFHGERSPCRVLSIRSRHGHFGTTPNKLSPLVVQVLVKFDTLQSVEGYSKKGTLLYKQDPKPVVEYLVLQKRMWYDTPWVVRNRFYKELDSTFEDV